MSEEFKDFHLHPIIKRLMKQNRALSESKATVLAREMYKRYEEDHIDEIEAKKKSDRDAFEKAIDWELLNEYIDLRNEGELD